MAITTEMRTQVLELYTAYFNRAADKAGVDYWTNEMDTNGWTLDQVAQSFADQDEYTTAYAGMDNAAIVTAVYTNVLNRDADTDGSAYWVSELDAGTMSVENLIQAVVAAAKEDKDGLGDADVLANKVAVSEHAYEKALDEAAAKAISLDAITADASSVAAVEAKIDDVVAEAAAEAAGMTYVMTNSNNQTTGGLDTVAGDFGNDTIIGSTAATGSTFALGDRVDGGAGYDKLYVTLNADSDSVDVVNVEQIDARAVTAAAFDASAVEGTGIVFNSYKSKADLEFTDISTLDSTVMITDNTEGLAVSYAASQVGGTADEITLKLNEAGSKAANDYFYTKNIETINIVSEGSQKNWLNDIGSDDDAVVTTIVGTDTLSKITVSGDQDLTIATALDATITTVDASEAKGAVTFGVETAVHTITGGAGDDYIDMNATLTSADTIDGGEGTDTLVVDQDIAASMTKVTNIEVIGLDATTANRSIDMSNFASATDLNVVAQATGNTVTVTNAGTAYKFSTSVDDDISITAKDTKSTATLTLDNSLKTAADTGIDLTNGGAGAADTQVFDNVKVLTIDSIGGHLLADSTDLLDGYNESSITGLSGSQLETLNVTGDTDIEITTADSGIKTVDASAATANVQVSIATATDKTITMGSGIDKVTLGTGKTTLDMGAGDDTVSIASANLTADDTIKGGEGIDTLVFSDTTTFDTISAKLSNVSGFEKISMANGTNLTLTDGAISKLGGNALTVIRENGVTAQSVNADSVNSSTTVVTVDGSSQTGAGALNYTIGLAQDMYTGTKNADTVTITDYQKLASTDVLNGGAGADTLNINIDGGASASDIKTLTAAQLTNVKSFNTINVDDATATHIGITLDNNFVDNNASSNALSIIGIDTTGGTATTALLTIDASAVTSTVALTLTGGSAADTIKGGAGDDVITGGAGNDKVDLSAGGADIINLDQATANNSVAITGFTLRGTDATAPVDMDKLYFDNSVFTGTTGLTASTGYNEGAGGTETLVDGAVNVITTKGYSDYDAMFADQTAGGDAAVIVVFYNTSTQAVEAYYDPDADDNLLEVQIASFTDISLSGLTDFDATNFVGY